MISLTIFPIISLLRLKTSGDGWMELVSSANLAKVPTTKFCKNIHSILILNKTILSSKLNSYLALE
jgi:hypothetical protein